MAGIDNSAILLKSDYQFKGPLTENYVLQQLQGLLTLRLAITRTSAEKSTLFCRTGPKSSRLKSRLVKINRLRR